ncbi:MAG: hypothetical protein IPM63_10025 [Acidobacteriota bacterium]|nr:MAG: hypothetical protein IPM63_10025 [Acidobacteriota bacterium]
MKLRLTEDEIRLRLSAAEVNDLAVLGRIDERIDLGSSAGGGFAFLLETGEFPSLSATFEAGELKVAIPSDLARRWTGTDLIGIEADQETGEKKVRILVEKDLGRRSARLQGRK